MNKSITQDNHNDNQISKTIRRFFTRFHISSALRSANLYKKKETPASLIFQYLFSGHYWFMQFIHIEPLDNYWNLE